MTQEFSNNTPSHPAWLDSPQGEALKQGVCAVLSMASSPWARRGQRLLVLNSGLGFHLSCLWEAGFDIIAHDDAEQKIAIARAILGHRAEYMLSQPDSLMCDDDEFSYALCLGALENWPAQSMQRVLHELHRVTTDGVILIYINSLSISNVQRQLGKLHPNPIYATDYPTCNPFSVYSKLKKEFPTASCHWYFSPLLPACMKKDKRICKIAQGIARWLPFGGIPLSAVHAVRIDFAPRHGMTGLALRTETTPSL